VGRAAEGDRVVVVELRLYVLWVVGKLWMLLRRRLSRRWLL